MPAPPTITLPNGESFRLFSDALFLHFPSLEPAMQRRIVRKMEEFVNDIHAHENAHYMVDAEYISQEAVDSMQPGELEKVREVLLTQITWRLALCYQLSNPSRISEAVPSLTYLDEVHKRLHGQNEMDATSGMFLAVALSYHDGQEDRSLTTFREAFKRIRPGFAPRNIIWARSHLARLLRQMERIPEAEREEKFTRQWLLKNASDAEFRDLEVFIRDDRHTGDHIFDHPEILAKFPSVDHRPGDPGEEEQHSLSSEETVVEDASDVPPAV